MVSAEELSIQLSGGGPWGFRLFGGGENPLVFAKVRQRSKAEEAGLREGDVLLSINGIDCHGMDHASAMQITEGSNQTLSFRVRRGQADNTAPQRGFPSQQVSQQAPSSSRPIGFEGHYDQPGQTDFRHRYNQQASPFNRGMPSRHQHNQPPQFSNQADASNQPDGRYQSPYEAPPMGFNTEQDQYARNTSFLQRNQTDIPVKPSSTTSAPSKPIVFQVSKFTTNARSGSAQTNFLPDTGRYVSSSPVIQLTDNTDQSVTMKIGVGSRGDNKENFAPPAPTVQQPQPRQTESMFKVSKIVSSSPSKGPSWLPSVTYQPPSQPTSLLASASSAQNGMEQEIGGKRQYKDYSNEEEDMPKPIPLHLTRILTEGGSSDSGADSPSFFDRKKKIFADSSFYNDPEKKYPTIEEQIKMARQVALSLMAPANKKARGQSMFMTRREKSEKWVAGRKNQDQIDGGGGRADKYYNPNPWKPIQTWAPPSPTSQRRNEDSGPFSPNAAMWSAPTIPSLSDKHKMGAMSAEELERMRLYSQKTDHTAISPQVCFSLADDLRKSKGKGGRLFAKRRAKAEEWVVGGENSVNANLAAPNINLRNKVAGKYQGEEPTAPPSPRRDLPAPMPSNEAETPYASGMPVNRLKEMVNPPKPKMTPWNAVADYGNVDLAFDHLAEYLADKPDAGVQQLSQHLNKASAKLSGTLSPGRGVAPTRGAPSFGFDTSNVDSSYNATSRSPASSYHGGETSTTLRPPWSGIGDNQGSQGQQSPSWSAGNTNQLLSIGRSPVPEASPSQRSPAWSPSATQGQKTAAPNFRPVNFKVPNSSGAIGFRASANQTPPRQTLFTDGYSGRGGGFCDL